MPSAGLEANAGAGTNIARFKIAARFLLLSLKILEYIQQSALSLRNNYEVLYINAYLIEKI